MFNTILHRVKTGLHSIASDPARASRTVFASLTVVALMAVTLDMGPRVLPGQFGASINNTDITRTPTSEMVDKLKTDHQLNLESEKLTKSVEACSKTRDEKDYDTFLTNFETAFGGILPGAGNLLLEHSAMVSKNRENLIYKSMRTYANEKFCVQPDQFQLVYVSEYQTTMSKLDAYLQTRLHEIDPDKYPTDEVNDMFITQLTKDYGLIEPDLRNTQKYLEDIIDRAIESAIALDKQTQIRVANMTQQTNNYYLDTLVKQTDQNTKIHNSTAKLLESIQKQDASENPYGGTTQKYDNTAYSGETYNVDIPTGVDRVESTTAEIRPPDISFGLLSLLDPEQREDFMTNHYKTEMSFYLASKFSFDPLTADKNALSATISGIAGNDLKDAYSNQIEALLGEDSSSIAISEENSTVASSTSGSSATKGSTSTASGSLSPSGSTNGTLSTLPVNIIEVKGTDVDSKPLPVEDQ